MTKIIIGSHVLLRALQTMGFSENDTYRVSVESNELFIQGKTLHVESNQDGLFYISGLSFVKLTGFLKHISEQPVTLELSATKSYFTLSDIIF